MLVSRGGYLLHTATPGYLAHACGGAGGDVVPCGGCPSGTTPRQFLVTGGEFLSCQPSDPTLACPPPGGTLEIGILTPPIELLVTQEEGNPCRWSAYTQVAFDGPVFPGGCDFSNGIGAVQGWVANSGDFWEISVGYTSAGYFYSFCYPYTNHACFNINSGFYGSRVGYNCQDALQVTVNQTFCGGLTHPQLRVRGTLLAVPIA